MQTLIFLEAPASSMMMPFFWVAMILVMYFFMFRPQMKRQKEQAAFSGGLEKGQDVVTASGMLGRINKIEGEIVTLEVGAKSYIRVTKSAISKDLTEQVHGKDKQKGPVDAAE